MTQLTVNIGSSCAVLPSRRPALQAPGLLLYLPHRDAVVVPYRRNLSGWHCVVVYQPCGRRGSSIAVNDAEVSSALPVRMSDPLFDVDAIAYGAIWRHRVAQAFDAGHLPILARLMIEGVVPGGRLIVDLAEPAARRVLRQMHVLPSALLQLLRRLVSAGFLTPARPKDGLDFGSYELNLPGHARPIQLTGPESRSYVI